MNESKIRPLHDRVLIRRSEHEKVSRGGIIIPDIAQEKGLEGEVIAVGPGKTLDNGKRLEPSVRVGDLVLFGKYVGATATGSVTRNEKLGDELVILREEDILAVLS